MNDDSRWNDWARNAKGKIDKKRDDTRLANQTLVTAQNLIQKKAPLVWATVRRDIQDMCKALNEQVGEDVLASDSAKVNEAVIRVVASGEKSTAAFEPETAIIQLRSLRTADVYSAVVHNGEVVFVLGQSPQQPHEIAKRFMDSVIAAI